MEAALRTVAEKVTGRTFDNLNYEDVRGEKGIKSATINLDGKEVKVVVASGLKNA